MKILESKDYLKFKSINGNRPVNRKKIEKIVSDINDGFNMLPYCPIIVVPIDGGEFHVIDGQHRLECSKVTENPVYYLEHNDITLKQIAQLNSRGEKWKANDFLNCYINVGIKDYEVIRDIMSEYKVNIKLATDLLMYNEHVSLSTEDFQSGNFKCNYLDETKEILTLVADIFGRYNFSTDRHLVGAMMRIKDKGLCDFDVLKDKISQAPNAMDKQANVKSYIYNIERVYNHKNSIRKTIY
jgi:hypothetical protein